MIHEAMLATVMTRQELEERLAQMADLAVCTSYDYDEPWNVAARLAYQALCNEWLKRGYGASRT